MKNKKRTFASMKKNILSKRRLIDLLLSSNTKPDAINRLMEVGKIIYVKKRTPIIEVGQVCDKGFFVLEGAFIARIYNPSTKKSRTQNFFLEDFNSFMSCEDSYFSGEKTNTDLLAIKDSMIIQFTKADLEKALSTVAPSDAPVVGVVATAGTTNAGIIDDLAGISEVSRA